MNRDELNQKAAKAGVPNPEKLDTKKDVIAATQAAEAPGAPADDTPNAVVVSLGADGLDVSVLGTVTVAEAPTLLKLGAKQVETQLGIE